MTRKRKPPTKRGPAFVSCGNCTADGWLKIVSRWGTMDVPSMKRCPCWLAHQERLERGQQESE